MTLAERLDTDPEFNYHMLRSALKDYRKNLSQLEAAEYRQVHRKASRSYELESLVIASPEANGVIVTEQQLDNSVNEVRARYPGQDELLEDLACNGLNEAGLRRALYRELLFDGVMQLVSANSADVNDLDVHLFYEMHRQRFETPETRLARHILITVNPDYPENSPLAARQRMQQVIDKLAGRGNRFEQFAKRYSECPTAMEGGGLGEVKRGQLYAELDSMLFNMQEGGISDIVETELGLHLLYCEKIRPAKCTPLSKAFARIRGHLQQRHRRNCQKVWLASLQKREHA
ncbi:MAG: nitrogen fixation protein NifM [gamma proteobacterium symbiont of Ctena orbiculata]|uniref:peptidylprolyl isomerase n=1 Tax=Candidatus Thiodiazotropha taylori TaxID=2792791 RepID=A0A944QWJ3_9GAMM|nr:nitrogen fixation protein NifM [Candidatus Thiodiazotropha taylori]PVV12913.1 MAG: nitrogen fixation protein NifM [gamma proteobacterium symbiont of Ctena orbiculata]MBT3026364.1 nitrogen fixation protein NifM [Candidatus Thiodiazotropha taylori]MBT3034514.1 nitrogen fixation protein NifM [Candidatus Thiodiazotropha taylori]MBV2136188.1 nitrogen fixation protein NifM [Candidatus Thiodiazotropha taylori]